MLISTAGMVEHEDRKLYRGADPRSKIIWRSFEGHKTDHY